MIESLDKREREITRFLYHEARLLDENRFHEWLDLLTEDVRYRMAPLETTQGRVAWDAHDGDLSFNLFDDDKPSMLMRIERLDTGLAYAETPRSVTQHLVSNIEVEMDEVTTVDVTVRSKFLVFQLRPGRHESHESLFMGDRVDRLRPTSGGWKIASREVHLSHAVLPRTVSILF